LANRKKRKRKLEAVWTYYCLEATKEKGTSNAAMQQNSNKNDTCFVWREKEEGVSFFPSSIFGGAN